MKQKNIRTLLIDVFCGMVQNSPTIINHIPKAGKKAKEMSKEDLEKCSDELKPYWNNIFNKIQEGTFFNDPKK